DQLVLEDLEHAHRASDPARRQAPALQAAQRDDVGAERDGFDDVAATLNTAVEHDLGSTAHGLGNLGQCVQAAEAMVDLAAAVIGDPDILHTMLDGDLGIFGGLYALEHERQAGQTFDAVQSVPGERSLEAASRRSAGALGWRLVTAQQGSLAA